MNILSKKRIHKKFDIGRTNFWPLEHDDNGKENDIKIDNHT